ncbi:hypothetical protein [Lake Baikal phage Baikal-20-5m-C28]|nr:hypothetical protein [Lake Baikal phage Baikal-20-5m-C28]
MTGFRSKKVAAIERLVSPEMLATIRPSEKNDLVDAIASLYDISRLVTASFPPRYGAILSMDIRHCADRLNELVV